MPGTSANVQNASCSSSIPAQKRAVLACLLLAPCSSKPRKRSRSGCNCSRSATNAGWSGWSAPASAHVLAVDREHLAGELEQLLAEPAGGRSGALRERGELPDG